MLSVVWLKGLLHSARELFRVGTSLTEMVVPVHAVSVVVRTRPDLLLLHFEEDRFLSGEYVQSVRSETLAQSITTHAFDETICYHAARFDPSHHVGLNRTDLFSQLSIRSKPDHLAQRRQIDTESLVTALRKRDVTKMVAEWVAIDHPHVTHETGSVTLPIPRRHGIAWTLRLCLRGRTSPLQWDALPYRFCRTSQDQRGKSSVLFAFGRSTRFWSWRWWW